MLLFGTTTLLILIDWQLAMLALSIVLVIFVLLLRFVRRIGPLFRQVQQTLGRALRRPVQAPVPRTGGRPWG